MVTLWRSVSIIALGLVLPAFAAGAAELKGVVTSAGKPVPSAIVTAENAASGIAVSVYSGKDGRYELGGLADGSYHLSAKTGTEISAPVSVAAGTVANIALARDADARNRIPSAQWLNLLPEGHHQRELLVNCASCHEIGAPRILVDGRARTAEEWKAAFEAMRAMDGYHIIPPDFKDDYYINWLATTFTDARIKDLKPAPAPDAATLAGVRITEYPLPDMSELPHDLVYGPDGRIWITAFHTDKIWALDPKTGQYQTYEVKAKDDKNWGQVRALMFDRTGKLWVILGGAHRLVRLDPKTGAFDSIDVGMYAHSLAMDSKGDIWINDYFSSPERIAKVDARTLKVTVIPVPSANLPKDAGPPLPYGLGIDGKDRLYSSQLAANTVVMYDIPTGKSKLFHMPVPNSGPRRLTVTPDGMVWIPEWNTGHLTRLDPDKGTFKRYSLGLPTTGAYAAEADPRTGKIWVTGGLASTMILFDPKTGTHLTYPMPTEPAYIRHLAIDPKTGDLWAAYSSMPTATPKVVRIERRG